MVSPRGIQPVTSSRRGRVCGKTREVSLWNKDGEEILGKTARKSLDLPARGKGRFAKKAQAEFLVAKGSRNARPQEGGCRNVKEERDLLIPRVGGYKRRA